MSGAGALADAGSSGRPCVTAGTRYPHAGVSVNRPRAILAVYVPRRRAATARRTSAFSFASRCAAIDLW